MTVNKPGRIEVAFEEGDLVSVLTTAPINTCLDYRAPAGGVLQGQYVEVPLGSRKVMGVVWGAGEGGVHPSKLKSILGVYGVPPMRQEMQDFLTRVGAYSVTPLTAMLRMAVKVRDIERGPRRQIVYELTNVEPVRQTPARLKVIEALREAAGPMGAKELATRAGTSTSVISGLTTIGTLRRLKIETEDKYGKLDPSLDTVKLNEGQQAAASDLCEKVAKGGFTATVLKGVTGSGKTEVYLEAVAEAIRQGRQVLVLLPEIALTTEFLERVAHRFGAVPGEWHSSVTAAQKRRLWQATARNEVQLVVGARSALFLPFRDLGLIIVDEEHDGSYKQDDGVIYSARDMAVMRAFIERATVVLASATPSLESWVNARDGKYDLLVLPARFGGAELPEIMAVDMRLEELEPGRWVSSVVRAEVQNRLDKGDQSLLFLNRRGFAPVTVCDSCGNQIGCDQCDACLVEHRFRQSLMCHQCGATMPKPPSCPHCEAEGGLRPVGPGVERIAEEIQTLFPSAETEILSSDLSNVGKSLKEKLEAITLGEVDIIIGTQMAAKGHNFPFLTFVGVMDADLGLYGGDLRAGERTFQLIHQVAGRAGRYGRKGLAALQTWQPEHPLIASILSGDDEAFWTREAEERAITGVPPFGRFAGIVITGPDEEQVKTLAGDMVRQSSQLADIRAQVLGPAPAPISRIRGMTRYRILVKCSKQVPLQRALIRWRDQFKLPSRVRVTIDIDPLRFS